MGCEAGHTGDVASASAVCCSARISTQGNIYFTPYIALQHTAESIA